MHPRIRTTRHGVTLLEVLFSVLIGAIGLLGAIALLPVASEQARKGRQADATAIAGEAFVNEIMTRRWFDPDNWLAYDGTNYLLHYQNKWYQSGSTTASTSGPNVGDSFCLDPRGFTLYTSMQPNYRVFPYGTSTGPWMHRIGIPARLSSGPRGYNYAPAEQAFTDLICTSADDLITERLQSDRSLPARQIFNPNAPTINDKLARESEGRISWIATFCPNTGNTGDEYILSVVCFYNRPLPVATLDTTAERETLVQLPGGGVTGGEITLLHANADALALHTGDWIMLKGPRNPTASNPARFRWYRVLDTEAEPQSISGGYSRDATVFGSDWTLPQDETQAVLLTGVTAVYERTVRIQRSSLWP